MNPAINTKSHKSLILNNLRRWPKGFRRNPLIINRLCSLVGIYAPMIEGLFFYLHYILPFLYPVDFFFYFLR
jgi:hypothetical protein